MDYSVLISNMTFYYFMNLAGVLIMTPALIVTIYRLNKFKIQNAVNPKNLKKINFIFHLTFNALFAFALIIFIMQIPPIFNDLPNVLKKNFRVDECLVIGQDSAGADDYRETRGVVLRSLTTGEEFHFLTSFTPIRKGEIYKVMYWPNSKIGSIIDKIK